MLSKASCPLDEVVPPFDREEFTPTALPQAAQNFALSPSSTPQLLQKAIAKHSFYYDFKPAY